MTTKIRHIANVADDKEPAIGQYSTVMLSTIWVNLDLNARSFSDYNDDLFKNLMDSIEQIGLEEPIIVVSRINPDNPKQLYLVKNGHRRYMAIKALERSGRRFPAIVPIIIRDIDNIDDDKLLSAEMAEAQLNNKAFTAVAKARAFRNILNGKNYTLDDLSTRSRTSKRMIQDHLNLLVLPDDVLQKIEDGEIRSTVAIEIANTIVAYPVFSKDPALTSRFIDELKGYKSAKDASAASARFLVALKKPETASEIPKGERKHTSDRPSNTPSGVPNGMVSGSVKKPVSNEEIEDSEEEESSLDKAVSKNISSTKTVAAKNIPEPFIPLAEKLQVISTGIASGTIPLADHSAIGMALLNEKMVMATPQVIKKVIEVITQMSLDDCMALLGHNDSDVELDDKLDDKLSEEIHEIKSSIPIDDFFK